MRKINKNYIFKDQNVSEIVKLLNKSEEKICFVVDRKKKIAFDFIYNLRLRICQFFAPNGQFYGGHDSLKSSQNLSRHP